MLIMLRKIVRSITFLLNRHKSKNKNQTLLQWMKTDTEYVLKFSYPEITYFYNMVDGVVWHKKFGVKTILSSNVKCLNDATDIAQTNHQCWITKHKEVQNDHNK